jgi:hypothetical protein
MIRLLVLLLAVLAVTPAGAEQRRLGLTSFDRIEVAGDMTVEVVNGHSIFALVDGSADALDTLEVTVENRVLRIRQLSMGRFGPRRANAGPVSVRVSAQNLRGAALQGAGRLTVEGLRGDQVALWLNGAGQLDVRGIDAQTLVLRSTGNGTMTLAGRARNAGASISGGGTIIADALTAEALTVTSTGSGAHRFTATRTAEVTISGLGGVTVAGRPRCTVRNLSSGSVVCGTPLMPAEPEVPPADVPAANVPAPTPAPAPAPTPVRRSLRNPGSGPT